MFVDCVVIYRLSDVVSQMAVLGLLLLISEPLIFAMALDVVLCYRRGVAVEVFAVDGVGGKFVHELPLWIDGTQHAVLSV